MECIRYCLPSSAGRVRSLERLLRGRGSFSEAGSHRVGLQGTGVINIDRHLSFNCYLSAKVKILLVKLTQVVETRA